MNIPYKRGAAAFAEKLKIREPFESNSMRGHCCNGRCREAYGLEDVDYVVISYATPIAWHSKSEGWYLPDEKYSSTTGRQQNLIREAILLLDCNYRRER